MIKQKTEVKHTFILELTESEMMALDGICGYGADPFLEIFYKNLGTLYLKPYEDGCRSLFGKVRSFDTPSKIRSSK